MIRKLNCKSLDEQLAVHCRMDPAVPKPGQVKVKALKLTALLEAVVRFTTHIESQGSSEVMIGMENSGDNLATGSQSDEVEEEEEELY